MDKPKKRKKPNRAARMKRKSEDADLINKYFDMAFQMGYRQALKDMGGERMNSKVLKIEDTVKTGGKYRHYKGGTYTILGLVKNATPEEVELMVWYESLESGEQWVREIHNFTGYTFKENEWKKRFVLIEE